MSRWLRKGISEFCELINHRTTRCCCGCPDPGDKKEEKEQSIPPVRSQWSQEKRGIEAGQKDALQDPQLLGAGMWGPEGV